jgi:hypothetical protein
VKVFHQQIEKLATAAVLKLKPNIPMQSVGVITALCLVDFALFSCFEIMLWFHSKTQVQNP